jgi:hypothetical protein
MLNWASGENLREANHQERPDLVSLVRGGDRSLKKEFLANGSHGHHRSPFWGPSPCMLLCNKV